MGEITIYGGGGIKGSHNINHFMFTNSKDEVKVRMLYGLSFFDGYTLRIGLKFPYF